MATHDRVSYELKFTPVEGIPRARDIKVVPTVHNLPSTETCRVMLMPNFFPVYVLQVSTTDSNILGYEAELSYMVGQFQRCLTVTLMRIGDFAFSYPFALFEKRVATVKIKLTPRYDK